MHHAGLFYSPWHTLRPVTCYWGEEAEPHLPTPSFQALVESDKVTLDPPFLRLNTPSSLSCSLLNLCSRHFTSSIALLLDLPQHLIVCSEGLRIGHRI